MSESAAIELPPAGLETPEKTQRVVAAMKARKEACAVLVDALLRIFDTNEKLEEALTGLSINTYYINKVMEAKCSVDARTEAVVLALCDHPPAT